MNASRRAMWVWAGALALTVPARLVGQETRVAPLAELMAAEDARLWAPDVFRRGLASADSVVRAAAAMAVGRVGDKAGTALLVPLLDDPDSTVRPAVAFALGLLRDTAAVGPLVTRLTTGVPIDTATAVEAIAALARIGGPVVGEFFESVINGRVRIPVSDTRPVQREALADAWRLGKHAPIAAILPFLDDTSAAIRRSAVFSLGRLRAPVAGSRLLAAVRDADMPIRQYAVRTLTKAYADSAGLTAESVADMLARAIDDDAPQVRINALRTLGTYHLPRLAARVAAHLNDPFPNAVVQAVATLGDLGGPDAVAALKAEVVSKHAYAIRREALLGLARADTAAFLAAAPAWLASQDWRERATAVEGLARATRDRASLAARLADPDSRVIAVALQSWTSADSMPPAVLVTQARALLTHRDAMVRSAAADVFAKLAAAADIPALVQAYLRSATDSFPDGAFSALAALRNIADSSAAAATRIEREFFAVVPKPASYLVRQWAEENWRLATVRWGPAYPLVTGRTPEEYRDLVRRFLVDGAPDRAPHVFIETDQRGTIELELFGVEAPLTVANFLAQVDRHYFNGNRWHRVVPNFVIQDGDPRGDGNGGPAGSVRDEINRRRYIQPMLGMALSGPDSGGSQWFINLSAQPTLDGTYTIFGRVVSGAALSRIVQGDVIRSIHR